MYNYSYPRPSVTCDIVLLTKDSSSKILLIKRGNAPFKNSWALPGGFIEMDETLEQSALRELKEETGIILTHLNQFRTYGNPGRDPRGRTISIVYFVQLEETLEAKAGDDASEAQWFDVTSLPELAFDHKNIISEIMAAL